MPELPEVETIKRQLNEVLVGQKIKSVEVLRAKCFEGNPSEVRGLKIIGISRKGKMLVVSLNEKGKAKSEKLMYLLIHLKMTGQLVYQEKAPSTKHQITNKLKKSQIKKINTRIVGGHPSESWVNSLPDKHTRVVIELENGTLFFNDMRVFGWIKLVESEKLKVIKAKMPYDVIDSEMNEERFWKILQGSARQIKLVVMDSAKIGGAGNIYANDGLWKAKIDPRRPAKTLTRSESDRLLQAVKSVVNLGIELGGASVTNFVHTSGMGGSYQDHMLTYKKDGEKCQRRGCDGVIEKIKLGGRGTFYCPSCQK